MRVAAGTDSAATVDGYDCTVATQDKEKRYPRKAGLEVVTCAVEMWGRIGDGFDLWLQDMHQKADQHATARGIPALNWSRSWRSTLSCGMARGVARSIAEALGSPAMQ